MPQGKGTYGTTRGRPPEKKKLKPAPHPEPAPMPGEAKAKSKLPMPSKSDPTTGGRPSSFIEIVIATPERKPPRAKQVAASRVKRRRKRDDEPASWNYEAGVTDEL